MQLDHRSDPASASGLELPEPGSLFNPAVVSISNRTRPALLLLKGITYRDAAEQISCAVNPHYAVSQEVLLNKTVLLNKPCC